MFSVIEVAEAGSAFAVWQSASPLFPIAAHPITGEFGRRYYRELAGDGYIDRCFAVVESGAPVLIVLCGVNCAKLSYFGMPVRVLPRDGLSRESIAGATAVAFKKIDDIALAHKLESAIVADFDSGVELSAVGKQCVNRGAIPTVHISGKCALDGGEEALRRGLRKSYRSLINWGERNLRMEFAGRENADASLFRQYQDLHKAVAGRSTRSQKSWDIMFEWIADGGGELVMGYLKSGELVAGTMVVDGSEVATYASGAYDRSKFGMPISHWPLWLAIRRSAERGRKTFDLGELPLAGVDQKEADIGFFKRGYTDVFATWMSWTWNFGIQK